jgi:GH15 family glucan-1,4-alpha-glucosidase
VPLHIEDYALLGDTQTAALVGNDGSVDWLCFPRFDSAACFAALLGEKSNGRFLISPAGGARSVSRRYVDGTLVLETVFETADGAVKIIDTMPPRGDAPDIVRIVEGVRGRVPMHMELIIRFDYGRTVPWVRRVDGGLVAIAGPDALRLVTPVETRGAGYTTVADFEVSEGDRVPFVLTWFPSHRPMPPPVDPEDALAESLGYWREWLAQSTYAGEWKEAVEQSLLVLKALTYGPTGGIVAAPTTSLPEEIGGSRNWDYRYCWLRDATFTLYAFQLGGYTEEAKAWREWLLRAIAGRPEEMQIMYGPAGERRLAEWEVPWLMGYEGSRPVRVGNAAHEQFQLDVYGEVMDAEHLARKAGLVDEDGQSWRVQRLLLDYLEGTWQRQDNGIWEIRSPGYNFTHSKVMAWVAFDRAVKAVERHRLEGPVDRWRATRAEIHEEVCRRGYDSQRNTFVQTYENDALDASLLMLPLVGFLPASDHRIQGTVEAIEQELVTEDGLVRRYPEYQHESMDGVEGGEGLFLACSFWLADNFSLIGRHDDAHRLFERLLDLRNDIGLLAEEWDPVRRRQVGNYPQALSHVALVNTAWNLSPASGPGHHLGHE